MKTFQWHFLHPRYWPSWLGLFLMRLTIYLPVRIQLWLGKIIAWMMAPFLKKRKRIARRNIELCFPQLSEEKRQQLLDENFRFMGMMLIETALSWWASDASLQKRVQYYGLEHLEAALEKGKGVILLTGHFTSMELGGRLMTLKQPGYVMFRQLKSLLFNAAMMQARIRNSEGVIMQGDPRAMVKALRKNGVVWYAPDQDYGSRQSVFAKFFEVQASTVTATARMVKMSGAAVIPFVPRREQDGSYTVSVGEPLNNFPTGNDVVDAQTINDLIEQEVRKSPEQYLWVHRRFKTQPEGKGLLYKKP
ncbi:MAG: lipid A biosynthesis acyltransferase [Gammaproteobacteria bacterium]|nr:MAG: lipid A biosynthesis acyltransferase [Gammaproteobacteria bacterium]RKZ99143.1 MAG: lipid A biosynthesis acyltransferase [Gammaproteobacteria bacterium]